MRTIADLDDPYPFYDRLRRTDPVHQIGDSQFHLVATWELVNDAVLRVSDFSSNLTGTMVLNVDGSVSVFPLAGPEDPSHVLGTADDPIHAVHRKLVLPTLVAKRVRALEPQIAKKARELWSDGMHDGQIDWMAAVGNRLPMLLVAELIGFPPTDIDWLVAGAFATTQMLSGAIDADQLGTAIGAAGELTRYLRNQFDQARKMPDDNLIGDLARQCNDGRLDSRVGVMMLVQLVGAGAESTAGLLGSAAMMLAERPDLADRLRTDLSLLPAFIEEVLRMESPFRGHYRHVMVDTTLGGVALKANSRLLLLWGSANRDPAAFEAPDEMRLDRTTRGHFGFGKGNHFCVGVALARLESRIALHMLLTETTDIRTTEPPAWVPSVTVRRLQRLHLEVDSPEGVTR
jgi:cytochrome P450